MFVTEREKSALLERAIDGKKKTLSQEKPGFCPKMYSACNSCTGIARALKYGARLG